MICVRLEGGLGNQLFQYAAGRALAHHHHTELILDTSTLVRRKRGVTSRQFELGNFKYSARIINNTESRLMPWMHRASAITHWISPWHTYVEKNLSFDSNFFSLPDHIYLVGYWQSFKYFSKIAKLIINDLSPVNHLSYRSSLVEEKIMNTNSIAIHVRRGDYVSLPAASRFHGVLPISYYSEAIRYICEKVQNCTFFVFSDDTSWCRNNLNIECESFFVENNEHNSAWEDLLLMSFCKHHIMANSSFSWWSSWMADQRFIPINRYVIAPSKWFISTTNIEIADRFPAHWVRL